MKKFFAILALLMILTASAVASASARKAGVIFCARDYVMADEKIQKMAMAKAAEIFPAPTFELIPMEDNNVIFTIYCEEHDLVSAEAGDGSSTAVTVIKPLKQENLKELGEKLGCDFLLYIRMDNTEPVVKGGRSGVGAFFLGGSSPKAATTITSDIRIFSVAKGEYHSAIQHSSKAKVSVDLGVATFSKNYRKELEQALAQVNVKGASLL